jgi:prepilin-type N-terminal cleavage/methylation domain-containing protein
MIFSFKARHSSFFGKKERIKKSGETAFTLIELLVSIGIFSIITTISVLNHSNFNGSILLTNLAYEIGLSIREAQIYGITVKGTSIDTTKFDSGYGVRFDMSTPTRYYIFEDRTPPNHSCDLLECGSAYENVLETFHIQRGNRISKVCVDGDCSPQIVDITFVRPNPDAYIRVNGVSYGKAEICVLSPYSGTKRKVVVESTGQISVTTNTGAVCD